MSVAYQHGLAIEIKGGSRGRIVAGASMNEEAILGRELGYLGLRLCLGLDFLLHGIARIFFGNYQPYLVEYMKRMAGSPLPMELIRGYLTALPFVEALIGFLLFVGLKTRHVAFAGLLVMWSLLLGTGLKEEWNGMQTQLLYAFLFTYLLMNIEWNHWSADSFLGRNQ